MLSRFVYGKSRHSYVHAVFTHRRAYRVEVHILNNEFLSELVGDYFRDFHIHAVELIPVHIFEGSEFRVGRHDELIFVRVVIRAYDTVAFFAAKILVHYLLKTSVRLDFGKNTIDLLQKFGLSLIHAERVFFFGKFNIYYFYFRNVIPARYQTRHANNYHNRN